MQHDLCRHSLPLSSRHVGAAVILLLATGGSAAADCTCRAGGRDYRLGERVCISGPSGPLMAVCAMSQNVSSWVFAKEACSVSQRPSLEHLAASTFSTH